MTRERLAELEHLTELESLRLDAPSSAPKAYLGIGELIAEVQRLQALIAGYDELAEWHISYLRGIGQEVVGSVGRLTDLRHGVEYRRSPEARAAEAEFLREVRATRAADVPENPATAP